MSLLLTASICLRFSVLNAQTLFCFMSTFFSSGFLLLSTIIGLAALPVSLQAFAIWALEFFSLIGVYVAMFFKILRRAFQILFLSFFLIIAFALPLFLLTSGMQEFSTFGFAIFTVFGYMLGEIQYENFIESKSNSAFLIATVVISGYNDDHCYGKPSYRSRCGRHRAEQT